MIIQKEKGFTLIEIMVALGILAFGILAIASMQTSALSGTTRANFLTQASTVAMDRMEKLMPLSWDQTVAEDDKTTQQGIYTITTDVVTDDPAVDTMTITVRVDWEEKGAQRIPVILTNIKNKL